MYSLSIKWMQSKGLTLNLTSKQMGTSEVLFYTLEIEDFTSAKKLVIITN